MSLKDWQCSSVAAVFDRDKNHTRKIWTSVFWMSAEEEIWYRQWENPRMHAWSTKQRLLVGPSRGSRVDFGMTESTPHRHNTLINNNRLRCVPYSKDQRLYCHTLLPWKGIITSYNEGTKEIKYSGLAGGIQAHHDSSGNMLLAFQASGSDCWPAEQTSASQSAQQ